MQNKDVGLFSFGAHLGALRGYTMTIHLSLQ